MVDVRGAEQPANAGLRAGGARPSEGPAYDDDWLRRCRQGDLAAWRQLYDQQFERVYRLVQRLGVPERDAADVCQEVFLRVHRGLGRFRGDAQIGTWLFRIALNESRRWGRLRGVRQALLALYSREPVVAPGQPDEALARAEGWRELGALLEQLKPKLREAFVLFEIEELSLDAGERGAGRGAETVKSRVKRARAEFERLRRQRALVAVAGGAGGSHEQSVDGRAGADPRRRPRGGPGAAARGPTLAIARAAGPRAPSNRAAGGGPAIPPLVDGRPVRGAGRGHRLCPGHLTRAAAAARPAGSAGGRRGSGRIGGPPAQLAAAAGTATATAASDTCTRAAAAAIEAGAGADAPGGHPAAGPAPAARRVVDVGRRRRA